MHEWIMDGQQDEPTLLVRVDHQGRLRGWQRADVSGVVEILSEVAYADAMGEDSNTITVFVLTDIAPVPVKVTETASPQFGMVEISLAWVDPVTRKAAKLTGYRNLMEV